MSIQINFDEMEETENQENTSLVDALVPPFGWIPVLRVAGDAVRLLHDGGSVHPCSRMAPLHSRSLRTRSSEIMPGQGVQVTDEFDPSGRWIPGVVESVDDVEIVVRTMHGSTFRVSPQCIKPLVESVPNVSSNLRPRLNQTITRPHRSRVSPADYALENYRDSLLDRGFRIVPMRGDGNCMFRSASHQIYGSDEYHSLVRLFCAEYMAIEKDYFEPFVAEISDRVTGRAPFTGYDNYIQELRMEGTWGDDPELQAICEVYQRPAEIYIWDRATKSAQILRKLNEGGQLTAPSRPQMRFSFLGGGHYDSIVETRVQSCNYPRPGLLEKRAIEIARARKAGGESRAARESDLLETEKAELEAALEKSRQATADASTGGISLQEALELSIKTVAEENNALVQKARMQSLQEAEEAELARAIQESRMNEELQPDSSYLPDDEDAMLRLAIEQSLQHH